MLLPFFAKFAISNSVYVSPQLKGESIVLTIVVNRRNAPPLEVMLELNQYSNLIQKFKTDKTLFDISPTTPYNWGLVLPRQNIGWNCFIRSSGKGYITIEDDSVSESIRLYYCHCYALMLYDENIKKEISYLQSLQAQMKSSSTDVVPMEID